MPGARWTDAEKTVVREHWRSAALPQVRALLPGRTEKAIRHKGYLLSGHRRRNWKDSKPPTERPTIRQIVWAAGIYEGEGSISRRKAMHKSIVVQLSQKDGWLPARLVKYFGGQAYHYKVAPSTCGNSPMWKWTLCGPRAWGFILTIYPLLSPRRQAQIREAMNG